MQGNEDSVLTRVNDLRGQRVLLLSQLARAAKVYQKVSAASAGRSRRRSALLPHAPKFELRLRRSSAH